MSNKKLCLSTFVSALLLSGCANLQIKNKEVCTVAGIMAAGANCANTNNDGARHMALGELIEMLEPHEQYTDENGNVVPERDGAMIMTSDHFNDMKTELEQGCEMLGKKCTYEMKEQMQTVIDRMEALRYRSRVGSNINKDINADEPSKEQP